jgi:hypothetical protein
MKGLIVGMNNETNNFYLAITAKKGILKVLEKFLLDLDLETRSFTTDFDPKTGEETTNYDVSKKIIDKHVIVRNNKYHTHLIFGPTRIHIIVITNKPNKEALKKVILKHFKFPATSLKKN